MRCGHCKGEHASVAEIRACSTSRSTSAAAPQRSAEQLEQARQHGLATAGLSKAPSDKEAAATTLRANPTTAEARLAKALKRLKHRFNAQVVIEGYIVDLYCYEAKLAIEVDGSIHRSRQVADGLRDDVLRANNVAVLRFSNAEVIDETERVVAEIVAAADARGRRGGFTPAIDAHWSLYRYSPEELGLKRQTTPSTPKPNAAVPPTPTTGTPPPGKPMRKAITCAACDLVRTSVDPKTGLCDSCTQRQLRARAATVKRQSPKRPFFCTTCRRTFYDEGGQIADCYQCGPAAVVKPKCRSCDKPAESVERTRWWCENCLQLRQIASESAGSGYTPSGPLRDQRSRARRIGRDS
jgi:very-short-patch-repair endonuclease